MWAENDGPIIQKYLELYETEESKTLWLNVRDIYTTDILAPLLGNLFADRLRRLRQSRRWPRGTSRRVQNILWRVAC
jgi:hypothetical protein